jgi:hypothetical protein
MTAADIAVALGDARRQSRAGASEIAAETETSRAAHPFNAVIDMITRSAPSHLRDNGEATALRPRNLPRGQPPAARFLQGGRNRRPIKWAI